MYIYIYIHTYMQTSDWWHVFNIKVEDDGIAQSATDQLPKM